MDARKIFDNSSDNSFVKNATLIGQNFNSHLSLKRFIAYQYFDSIQIFQLSADDF